MKKIINNYKKWNPSTLATILLLLMPFIVFMFVDFKLNNDFWFLINTGKTIIKDGFISIEPFTIHSGLHFLPQQWLIDVLFNFIYQNFNIYGMYVLVLLCNLLIIYLFYRISYLMSNNRKMSIFITIILDSFLIVIGLITTRPHLFDIIIFSIELLLLELYVKNGKKNYLFFIPLLSLFMINSHASMWAMLFVFMLPYYAEYIILKIRRKEVFKIIPLVITTIISILIAFINPYGIESIKYIFNSYGVSKINLIVNEMKIISISDSFGKFVFLCILFILYSFYRNKGNNKIRFCFLTIGIIYLTLSHYKCLVFFVVICPFVLAYNFKNNEKKNTIKTVLYEKVIYIVMIVLIMALTLFKVHLDDNADVKEFADYLDKNASKDIKLFTDYNDGGYMEYRGYKCYIDPRAEVFLKNNNQKEDIFDEYYKLEENDIDYEEFLNKYNFDYLLVNNSSKHFLNYLQKNDEYQEVLAMYTDVKYDIKTYLFKRIESNRENKKSN